MLITLVALAQIRSSTQGRDPKREVLEEFEYPNIENCEKITEQSAKELTFTPSNNIYCFTTEYSFYIDGYVTIYQYSDSYSNTDRFYKYTSSETTYAIKYTFFEDEENYKINIFFEPKEIAEIRNENCINKYIINNNFDDIIYSRYQYDESVKLDTSATNVDYVVVLGKKGAYVKVSSDAKIVPFGNTPASITDGYTLQKPEILIFSIEPLDDKKEASKTVDVNMKIKITGHTSIVSNYNFYLTDIYYFEDINYNVFTKPFIYERGELAKLGDVFQDCDKLEDYTEYNPNIISKKSSETKNFCFKAKNSFVIMQPNTVLYKKDGSYVSKYENLLAYKCYYEEYFKLEFNSVESVDIQFLPNNEEYSSTNYYIISKSGDYTITSRYVIKSNQIYQYFVDTVIVLGKNNLKATTTSKNEEIIIKEFTSSGGIKEGEFTHENSGSVAFYGTIDIASAEDDTYVTNIAVSVTNNDKLSVPNFYFDSKQSRIYYDAVEEKSPRDYSRGELAFLPTEYDECKDLDYIDEYSTGCKKLEFISSKKSICIKTKFGLLIEKKGIEVYQYNDDDKGLNHYENVLAIYGSPRSGKEYYYKIICPDISEEQTTTVNLYLLPNNNYVDNNFYYIICNNFDGSIYARYADDMRLFDSVVIPGSAGTNVQITKDENEEYTEIYELSGGSSKLSAIKSSSGYTHISEEVTSAFGNFRTHSDQDEIEYTKINVKVTNQVNTEFPKFNFYVKKDQILTYDNVTEAKPYDYTKGLKVILPKEFEDCEEIEESNGITKTIEFTPTKSVYCFMSSGSLIVEGKGVTVHKIGLNENEATNKENVMATWSTADEDNEDVYFYKLTYKTAQESEKINIHFTSYNRQKPYLILGSSFEGELNLGKDEIGCIVILGSEGRNVKVFSEDTTYFGLKFSDYRNDDEKGNYLQRKIVTDEGYTFSQNQYLVIVFIEKCKLKVTGKRTEVFPDANFYLETDLSYAEAEKLVSEKIDDGNDKGLSGGAIAGIVIACIVVVAVICVAVWWFKFHNNTEEIKNNEENEKAEEDKNEGFYIDKSNTEV